MSEQQQRAAWLLLAVAAVILTLATFYVYFRSQQGMASDRLSYRMVYNADAGDGLRLMQCSADGLDCTQLTSGDSTDLLPAAEPPSGASDEPRIAFLRIGEQGQESGAAGLGMPGGVYILGTRSKELTRVSTGVERVLGVAPSWSPDGTQLAFGAVEDLNADGEFAWDESGIYVSDVDGLQTEHIASGVAGGRKLSWSPSGDVLLVTGIEAGQPVPFVYALEVSSGVTITHPTIGQIAAACWSPDGSQVAVYSRQDHQVHVLDLQGEEIVAFDGPYGDILEIIWVPGADGDAGQGRLFAVAGHDYELGAGPLYERSASGASNQRWRPVAGAQAYTAMLSASPDGQYVAFTGFTSEQEGDLFVLERGDAQARQMTSDPGFEGLATWLVTPLP